MPHVACFMMQRNEDDLLEPWLAYHGYLFGFENLHVFDNGSTSPAVLSVIARYKAAGVNFIFGHSGPEHFEAKSQILVDAINRAKLGREPPDICMPMDCDEFVALLTIEGLTCGRGDIDAYLSRFVGKQVVLVISDLLLNAPGTPYGFYFEGQRKVFFASGRVAELEPGHHYAQLAHAAAAIETGLKNVHLHNRPLDALLRSARAKLKSRVNLKSRKAMHAYKGMGDHLTPYFTMTDESYQQRFAPLDVVLFPQFIALLDALHVLEGVDRVCRPDRIDANRTGVTLPALDGPAYLEANPDVLRARQLPLIHYYYHGRQENRRLRRSNAANPRV